MKRDIDFLKVYKVKNSFRLKTFTLNGKAEKVAIASIIVMLIISGSLLYYNKYINNLVKEKQLSVNNSETAVTFENIADKQVVYEDVKIYNQLVQDTMSKIQSLPRLTNTEYLTIKSNLLPEMQLLSMNYSKDSYVLTMSAPYARNIPQYVSNIKNSGIFREVNYNGYSLRAAGNIFISEAPAFVNSQYVFTISCVLKSGVNNEIN
ncbi:MAG: hypothetical protein AB7V48_03360 [Sedimentibacter sp.]